MKDKLTLHISKESLVGVRSQVDMRKRLPPAMHKQEYLQDFENASMREGYSH
ncbi:MAG: hypothetical protein HKO89_08535 [Saprospiraceae bacterium]|nr:hypothetical protein [Saprospiraceae bacterium]